MSNGADGIKPYLPSDKIYIGKVAETIRASDDQEPVKFELLTQALAALDVVQDPYQLVSLDNLSPQAINDLISQSYKAIQSRKNDDSIVSILVGLWGYLAEEDPVELSDLAFVFGGPNPQRAQIAINLYKDKVVKKILFSGRQASYIKDSDNTEAEAYRQLAVEQSVPVGDIMIETEARNTPENAAKSVELMKAQNYQPARIIAITLPYHIRRSYLTLKAATEDWRPIILRKVAPSSKFTSDNYFLSPHGWSYIFNEFIKLYGARLMKHF